MRRTIATDALLIVAGLVLAVLLSAGVNARRIEITPPDQAAEAVANRAALAEWRAYSEWQLTIAEGKPKGDQDAAKALWVSKTAERKAKDAKAAAEKAKAAAKPK